MARPTRREVEAALAHDNWCRRLAHPECCGPAVSTPGLRPWPEGATMEQQAQRIVAHVLHRRLPGHGHG